MKSWSISLFLLLMVVLGIGFQKITLTSEPELTMAREVTSDPGVVQKLSGVHIIENSGLKTVWELWAETGSLSSQQEWQVNTIKAKFFGDKGIVYKVVADLGTVINYDNQEAQKLALKGDVTTQSSNGYAIISKEVIFDKEAKQLIFPGRVKIQSPGSTAQRVTLTGQSMTLDLTTNNLQIHSQVSVTGKRNEEDLFLSASQAVIKSGAEEISFLGNVVMKISEFTLNSQLASFYFSQTSLLSALLSKELEVTSDDKTITAEQLHVDFVNPMYVFTGNTKLESGSDSLMGDEITISEEGKKIKVVNAKARFHPDQKITPLRTPNF